MGLHLKNKIMTGRLSSLRDKKMGRHCGFLNAYVAIHVKYAKNEAAVRSCEESDCNNSKCNLSKCYIGDRSAGKDFLDQPKK